MEEFAHIAGHVLEHSVADTLYIIPFLFVTYLVMEWLEHKTSGRTEAAVQRAGAAGPAVGRSCGRRAAMRLLGWRRQRCGAGTRDHARDTVRGLFVYVR